MLNKYRPTKTSEIVGNKTAIQTIEKWMASWKSNTQKQTTMSCLISGPCGIGKTLTLDLLINSVEYNVIEVNTDDERNATYINQKIKPFVKTSKNIWGKNNILIVNDIDVSNDNGFVSSLCECIKETKIPIILTCNNRYEPKIKPIATLCALMDIKFTKPSSTEILKYVADIVKTEYGKITPKQTQLIQSIVNKSDGDVRNTILSVEFALSCNTSFSPIGEMDKDNSKINLFDITTELMSQMTELPTKFDLFHMEKELLPLMVHENYPLNIVKTKTIHETLTNLCNASSGISDMDLLPYDYTSIGVMKCVASCHPKTKINFTGYLGKTSTRTKKSTIINTIETNMGLPVGHFRLDYMSYLLLLLYHNISSPSVFVEKCRNYGFTKDDIQENLGFLLLSNNEYSKCDYSVIDKKIKATITKLFNATPVIEQTKPTVRKKTTSALIQTQPSIEPVKTSKRAPKKPIEPLPVEPFIEPVKTSKRVSKKKTEVSEESIKMDVKVEHQNIISDKPVENPVEKHIPVITEVNQVINTVNTSMVTNIGEKPTKTVVIKRKPKKNITEEPAVISNTICSQPTEEPIKNTDVEKPSKTIIKRRTTKKTTE